MILLLKIIYKSAIIKLSLYIQFLSLFFALKAGILNIGGNKFKPNG